MTNIDKVIALVSSNCEVKKTETIDKHQVSFEVDKTSVHRILSVLKLNGYKQLSYLSAIDWLEDNEFELVYIVMNWEEAIHVQVRCRIDRQNPEMNSILSIYEGCKYYEREAHEFFGIKFPGNPDFHKQLILEEWKDIPPLRKDFDPKAYSDAHFAKREYTKDFKNLNKQESNQEKRKQRKSFIDRLKGGTK